MNAYDSYCRFRLGQRVQRDCESSYPYIKNSGKRVGVIIRVYGQLEEQIGQDMILGPYPELYRVLWDSGEIGNGYFPHGLQAEDKP